MPTLCTIYSLSPSDSSIQKAQLELASLIPKKGKTKTQVPSLKPNHAAVVLLVEIGNDFILLGSDLENTGDPGTGWSAIINSQSRPQGRASFFKIPHHGSANADNPDTWSLLLGTNPFSVLSPFASGGISLPTKKDVIRISEKTDKAYSTAIPKQIQFKPIDKMVDKFLKERGLPISQVQFSTGQVRARGRYINGKLTWTVDLFRGALPLGKIYQ
jgi:beta-lactamase superfamily II metal-dependent hydrolase